MKRGDYWLLALLIVIVAAFLLPRFIGGEWDANAYQGKTFVKITVDGELFQTVELTTDAQDIEIRTERGYNLLRIYDQGIEVIDADCRDGICKSYGFIQRVGQTIVCLPNRVFIEIIGDSSKGDGIDALVN